MKISKSINDFNALCGNISMLKGNPFIYPYHNPDGILPNGYIPSDKQKCQLKAQHEFTIKGVKIMAASRKDAIKKFNHIKK